MTAAAWPDFLKTPRERELDGVEAAVPLPAAPHVAPAPTPDASPMAKAARRIRPLDDRVLVRRPKNARQVGLVTIVSSNRDDLVTSEVIAIGSRVKLRPWELAVGDFVMHPRVSGAKYDNSLGRLDEEGDLVFLHEDELIAAVDPGAVVSGSLTYDAAGRCDLGTK